MEEFSKYRHAKSGELSNLQASYDSLKQSHESSQASLKALQSSHTTQSHKMQKSGKTFTEVYADFVRLQDEFAQKCAEYDGPYILAERASHLSTVHNFLSEPSCRRPFFHNNAQNTNDSSLRRQSFLLSSPKRLVNAKCKAISLRKTPKSRISRSVKMSCCRNNWKISAVRSNNYCVKLPGAMIQLCSPLLTKTCSIW